jgi:hypothetical protein
VFDSTLRQLYLWDRTTAPIEQESGVTQRRYGEDKIFVPAGIRAVDQPAPNLIFTPATLTRLPQHGKAKQSLYRLIQSHKVPRG